MKTHNKITAEKIKEILKRSSDSHNVFTPFELCDEMLDKIPELNKEQSILVMFNLEFIYIIREKFGKEGLNNLWFLTPDEFKKKAAIIMGVHENHTVIYEYNRIIGIENMPKFDVVVGNPPYQRELHIDFLNLSFNMLKDNGKLVFVHPSSWLLDERNLKKSVKTRNLIGNYIIDLTLINGNLIFGIKAFGPCVINFIDKSINNKGVIKVIDKIRNKTLIYNNINDVNKWSDLKIYPALKNKILQNVIDNFENHKRVDLEPTKKYLINLSYVRGNTNLETMISEDFYTFVPKDKIVETKKTHPIYFQFDTEKEAQNFLNYIKTDFTRFCLSIYKLNQHFKYSMGAVPWMDFSKEWTDDKLYKYFDLTKEEIKFIEDNIPKYY